jgi:uncharacterized protein YkwD
VKCPSLRQLGCLLILWCGSLASASWANPVSAVQLLRVSGCGGILPAYPPLQPNGQLDRAAALWAAGGSPGAAAAHSGYRAQVAVGLRLAGPDDSILQSLRRTRCRPADDQTLRDVGVYRQGSQTWLVIAAPAAEPAPAQIQSPVPEDNEPAPRAFAYATAPSAERPAVLARTSAAAQRVLKLVNEIRASGSRCGEKSFGPAAPLQDSGTLDGVAADHAGDMARHDYFEHVDLNGNTPADRVRATGYRERLVGENIAYGPTSAEEVVSGWLHSTGHCENIMDPRFVEMGLATAPGQGSRRGLYWDQVLAEPAK